MIFGFGNFGGGGGGGGDGIESRLNSIEGNHAMLTQSCRFINVSLVALQTQIETLHKKITDLESRVAALAVKNVDD